MTMTNKKLTIFIPAYKEAQNLKVLLPRLVKTLSEFEPSYEILVVDTIEPMDDAKMVCQSVMGNIIYANRTGGNNFGDAVRKGISLASGDFFIAMDGDGSHEPEFINTMYGQKDSADVIIASRYVQGGDTENPKALILMSHILNFIYSLVLNLNCKDVSNSFKLYKTDALKRLNLKCNNFDVVEEILFKLKKANRNLIIKELPFTFKARMFGKTKRNLVLFIGTFIYTLLKLRFSK